MNAWKRRSKVVNNMAMSWEIINKSNTSALAKEAVLGVRLILIKTLVKKMIISRHETVNSHNLRSQGHQSTLLNSDSYTHRCIFKSVRLI